MNYKDNKNGFACIDAIPAILALIICLAAMVDMITILKKINVISTTATYVSRTIGPQGGSLQTAPSYYAGCKNSSTDESCKYTNVSTLQENVEDMMGSVGLNKEQYTITIAAKDKDGKTLKTYDLNNGNSHGINTDYGNYLEVNLTVNYQWEYISKVIGLKPEYNKSSHRYVMSTFKIRE